MKISIITVCYNSVSTIRDTIESVLSQNYPDIEYIIIDGASTDNTVSIINEYQGEIAHYSSEKDQGIYDAMNKGLQVATGDIIGILNSDDFYDNDKVLTSIAKCFEHSPESDIVFGDVVFVKPDQLNKIIRHYSARHFKAWKLRFGWMPPHPATFIRKNAYQITGRYSLDYKISADYEMFIRMLMIKKLKFTYIDKVLIKMRSGGISTSGIRSNICLNTEIVRACRTNNIYTNILFVLSKIPFKLVELIRKPL